MTAVPEPDDDPYILPMPTPATPVVLADHVTDLNAHLNVRYSSQIWPLAPLTTNPSESKYTVHWSNCPTEFWDKLKLPLWTMINGELRPTFIRERHRLRGRISISVLYQTAANWMHLATWLKARGLHDLADCDTGVLHDYGQHLLGKGHTRVRMQSILASLTRLWAFDQLSAHPAGIGRPPWDEHGADDYLPAATRVTGENATEPLAEQTMGPLLVWAMRVVDDLADDILRSYEETQRLLQIGRTNTSTPEGKAALDAYLRPLIDGRAPLPTSVLNGRPALARWYIGGITGASGGQIEKYVADFGLVAAARQNPGPCPLDLPVTGRIADAPWREALDLAETKRLMMHLGTACFIVIAYLTGMRPGEILGLRSGSCPDPEPGPGHKAGRHLIRSTVFKTAKDEHGNHLSAGEERAVPWVAITPVVNAIRVLERIVPAGSLLFDHLAHDVSKRRVGTGSLKHSAIRDRIEKFIVWANTEATAHALHNELIPPDPHGNIGTERFRRSLAWHIARRPGGLVALAIQYGHLRTAFSSITDGYASRGRGGIHDLIDIETVRAVADTVTDLNHDLVDGAGISGPAARRAIKAAAQAPRFAGVVIDANTARRLIANEDAMIYDNPQALVLCHYKRAQALCHRDGIREAPTLDRCVPGCGNIIRTDQHAIQLRERADTLDKQAAFAPQPISDRLRANAARLRDLADDHDSTRITLEDAG